jgi:hypothetical protein
MANGKPHDNPLSDLLIHGWHPFPLDIEAMILEIVKLDSPQALNDLGMKVFDWEEGKNLDEARALLGKKLETLRRKRSSE